MTPLEAMAKAHEEEMELWFGIGPNKSTHMQYWVCRSKEDGGNGRYTVEADDIHDETEAKFILDRLREQASMRAALLALAEVELPQDIRRIGARELDLSDELKDDIFMDMGDAFRAICRSLADTEEKSDG